MLDQEEALHQAKLMASFFTLGCWKKQLRASPAREQEISRASMLCPAPYSGLVHPGNGATMENTDKSFNQHFFHVKLNNRANKKEQD